MDQWPDRDAAVVWPGFTDLAAYVAHSPVVVERAEGHELIGTDGRRYLDAISSVWVSTMGHGVPELDEALRDQLREVVAALVAEARARVERLDRVAA